MKLTIDSDSQTITREDGGNTQTAELFSKQAFEWLSREWLKVGWNQKYSYSFTWLGRPLIQLPEDMFRIQEVIYRVKPDVIVETGVAHGGSLIFYASLFHIMKKGRVIGVDIDIKPHNRKAIDAHPLASWITLVEGDSTDPKVLESIRALIHPGETVMVILDSCHTKDHVARELGSYSSLVTRGSYIVATDGIMQDLFDVPRGKPEWKWDNPMAAAAEFAQRHSEFVLEQPALSFDESESSGEVTYWPGAFLRRK